MPDLPRDMRERWESWLDGTCADDDLGALTAWAEGHPEVLPILRREATMHVALGYHLGDAAAGARLRAAVMARVQPRSDARGSGPFARRVMTRLPPRRTTRGFRSWIAPALACAALVALAAWWQLASIPTAPQAHALVTVQRGPVTIGGRTLVSGATSAAPVGSTISAASGASAEVRLGDGSVLTLADDAVLQPLADSWRLDRGALAVVAAPQRPG
ncbi:MAG: hypothetical protein H0V44_04750, partial [Planctomycetes bacterium]|nr:hypothetical protein [Planctomycetota bacterium]